MATEQRANRAPTLSLRPDQALVGVPVSENGQELTHIFAEEDDARTTSPSAVSTDIGQPDEEDLPS